MRKSFKLIVFISVSAILSLVLALFIAPLRSSFSEYSNNMKDKAVNAVSVNFNGANNGIGAVNSNRIESTIELGSIKSGNGKKATSTNSNSGNIEQSAISYSLQAYAQKVQGARSASGAGAAGSGVLASSSNGNSSTAIQGALGINSTPSRNNVSANSPALIGFNTLTTDLTSVNLASQGGPQAAGKNPPPEEGIVSGSLPIGDGTSLMFFMALIFVGLKTFRIKVA